MVGLIGISHQTALLEIREQLVISKEEIPGLYEYLNRQCDITGILALSTCNRTELYFEADSALIQDSADFIKEVTAAYIAYFKKPETVKQYLYTHTGINCARHLFRVTTGLDSMILGEYQIVSQIKEAFSYVDNTAMVGPELTRMVHKAFEAGKEVRTRTSINKGAVSVSSAAVELASKKLGCLSNITALTVGSGETGTIVALNLSKKGCVNNWVTNRTQGKAEQLADRINGKVVDFDNFSSSLKDVDVITFTTGSQRVLFDQAMAQAVMNLRQNKPLMVLDLSNPRNVESTVGDIEGITVFDLDHLEEVVKANFEKRKGKLVEAEAIIDEVLEEFEDWLNVRRMSSAISSITSTFKSISANEARNYKKVKDDDGARKISEYGDHLSSKFTRMIIKQIRDVTNEGRDPEKVKMIEEFFNFSS
ncbi:glutamyl-tRNA reductase [Carboxylicivirga sp. N1Y90]|uniref:glutamyl-tRNA reductase n=1 Tax=Carboxylicivirga fragile TaxID=3417571 RepID=UPI003D345869|nr:glutamyl-tRNA reductase [Marinilabiliaceae bacterium N1Y90]